MGYIGSGVQRFNTADGLTVTGDATIDTTTLVVDSTNNNVGIGTASPEDFGGGYTTLEVAGSSTANGGIFKTATSDSAGTGTAGTEMLMYSNNGGGVITVTSSDPLLFQTAGAERMRITSDGNVGIGTSAPAHNVEIVATAAGSVNDSLQIRNNATSSGTGSRIRFINSTDNTSDANGAAIASVRNGDDNDLVFETENATRMTIDHAGKVGISNTAPDFNLSVGNSSSVNPSIQIMSATNSNAQLLFGDGAGAAGYRGTVVYGNATDSMSFSTAGAERMRLDSNGVLLVGKTADSISNNGISAAGSATGGGFLSVTNDGNASATFNRKSSDGEIIQLRKDGTTVGVIGTQNWGIGTASPTSSSGGKLLAIETTADEHTNLVFNTANTGRNGIIEGRRTGRSGSERFAQINIQNDSDNGEIRFYTAPSGSDVSERMRIDSSGNVGIGVSSMTNKLVLPNAAYLAMQDTSGAESLAIRANTSNAMEFITGGGERGRFSATGNLLLGQSSTDTPGTGNTTTGTSLRGLGDGFFSRSNGEALYLNRNNDGGMISIRRSNSQVGVISVTTSGTTYTTTSDIRLKQDIELLEATDKLMQMNPVSYSWKADPDGPRSMGFIAQEMQEVMPEAVSTGDDDMMSMDYGRITPILVSALQDAHRKIDELAAEIAELKAS